VSAVSVCSALNEVVMVRWSIHAAMLSTNGTMVNTPGPRSPT